MPGFRKNQWRRLRARLIALIELGKLKLGMRKPPTNDPASAKLKEHIAANDKTWSLLEEPFITPQPEGRKTFRLPKVEALAKEVEAQRERLQKEPRTSTQSMERLVRKVEDVAERADCTGGWFAQFDEAHGGTSIESWRHIVRLLPSDLAARMARACLRLAQSAQRDGLALEVQWELYSPALSLFPLQLDALLHAQKLIHDLRLNTPESRHILILADIYMKKL